MQKPLVLFAVVLLAAVSLFFQGGLSYPNIANMSVDGIGFMIGPGLALGNAINTTTNPLVTNGQDVRLIQLVLHDRITISHITYAAAATVGSSTITVGVYDSRCTTKLIDSGTFDGGSSSAQVKTITAVTLNPGVYFYAQSASTGTTLTGICVQNHTNGAFWSGSPSYFNAHVVRQGMAANAASSGVLPSSAG
jgi:hypothetical protein